MKMRQLLSVLFTFCLASITSGCLAMKFHDIDSPDPRKKAYVGFLLAAMDKQPDKAIEVLREAFGDSKNLDDKTSQAIIYCHTAYIYLTNKDLKVDVKVVGSEPDKAGEKIMFYYRKAAYIFGNDSIKPVDKFFASVCMGGFAAELIVRQDMKRAFKFYSKALLYINSVTKDDVRKMSEYYNHPEADVYDGVKKGKKYLWERFAAILTIMRQSAQEKNGK